MLRLASTLASRSPLSVQTTPAETGVRKEWLALPPIATARPHDGNDHRRHRRIRAGVDSGADPLRYRRRKSARQAPWAPARAEAEIRSARSKSACTCRCGKELSPDQPRIGA